MSSTLTLLPNSNCHRRVSRRAKQQSVTGYSFFFHYIILTATFRWIFYSWITPQHFLHGLNLFLVSRRWHWDRHTIYLIAISFNRINTMLCLLLSGDLNCWSCHPWWWLLLEKKHLFPWLHLELFLSLSLLGIYSDVVLLLFCRWWV